MSTDERKYKSYFKIDTPYYSVKDGFYGGAIRSWYDPDSTAKPAFITDPKETRVLHHDWHPAYIQYWPNGNIQRWTYYNQGVFHRLDGPAHAMYKQDGTLMYYLWAVDGVSYTEEEIDNAGI